MLVHETSGKRTVDMVSSSIHTRLTRTSSDLRILSAVLLPPSPILKPDDLLISSTSGEIPILLEARTHACNAPLTLSEPPEFWNLGKLSTTGNMRNLTRHDEALREHWMHVESDELCYITAELQNDCHAQSPGDFLPAGAVPGDLKNAPHPAYYGFLGGDSRRPGKQDDCSLPILGLGQGDFEGSRDPQASYPSTTALTSTTVVPKDLDGGQLPMIATFHTYSTLPTPTFAPPSPSPSADVISLSSSPTSWRHRRPLERARAVRFPGRARSPRLQVNEVEAHLMRNAPPSPTKDAYPRWQLADPTLMTSGYAYTTETVRLFPKHVALPEGLSWLKHMAIELWIDQEGFRSVRPCMQLIGYSPRTRSLHPYESAENAGSDITAGVAEFMPIKRETFTFHYATLDSPPTLRMVSVVGDESRDYTSRQATLSVKLNGVYTVLGTETFMASTPDYDAHGSRLQNVIQRLRWKFDYLVSDRKVDGTGKALTGEKTLTPLTFSCSPYLFHPLQGKKAGLMRTMRKNLVPKLGSQRLEPPSPASSRGILPRSCRHLESGREPVATHARSHSDAFARGGRRLHTRSQLDNGVGGEAKGMDRVQRARRRRASSAGEESSTCLRLNEPRQGRTVPPREGMFMQTSPTLF